MPIGFLKEHFDTLRYVLPLVAIAGVLAMAALRRWPKRYVGIVLTVVLLFSANLAVWKFSQPYWRSKRYLNPYEFFHYYIAAKYAHELGYDHLYDAALIALDEKGYKVRDYTVRNLATHHFMRATHVLAKRKTYKDMFTEARWQEFAKDVVFFRKPGSVRLWKQILRDKGYNATPVYTAIASFLANRVSTDNPAGMQGLAALDVLFFLAALLSVWWAFDHRIALLMLIMMGSHYLMSEHYTLKAAFLRLDWVMCMVMAVCMVKKKYYAVAGALMAYATMARVFPLIFVFGIGARMSWAFLQTFRIERKYLRFGIGFCAAAGVLVGLSVLFDGGFGLWRDFLSRIGRHNADIAPWRVGFKYIFLMSYAGEAFWGQPLLEFFEAHKAWWWAIQLLMLAVSFVAVRRLSDDEALAYGYVPAFFLTASTYYYHVMLLVPFLFFARRLERPERLIGVVLMFATSIVSYRMYEAWNRGYRLFFAISCLIFVMVLYLIVLSLIENFRKPEPEPEDAEKAESPPPEEPQEAAA